MFVVCCLFFFPGKKYRNWIDTARDFKLWRKIKRYINSLLLWSCVLKQRLATLTAKQNILPYPLKYELPAFFIFTKWSRLYVENVVKEIWILLTHIVTDTAVLYLKYWVRHTISICPRWRQVFPLEDKNAIFQYVYSPTVLLLLFLSSFCHANFFTAVACKIGLDGVQFREITFYNNSYFFPL